MAKSSRSTNSVSAGSNLEEQLREVGNELSNFPTAIDQLICLLDKAQDLLAEVEQSPSESIKNACSECMKALLAEPLFRHTDADVQVAVASCISEFTRITAPEAPFADNQMKEVLHLIVSSFKDLSDMSSRTYEHRVHILETVDKVKTVNIILDLECDELLSKMFQHFLTSIRNSHPRKIFRLMDSIMTTVLKECDDVSPELLDPILASVIKNNEEVSNSTWKLGVSVLAKCAVKIKPYVKQAVNLRGLALDVYSEIVAAICNECNAEVEHNNGSVSLQKNKPNAAELLSTPSRHGDKTATSAAKRRRLLTTEVIQTELGNTAFGDNAPASGSKPQSQSQATNSKRTTKSKHDDEQQSSKLEETVGILAGALKDVVDDKKLPIPVEELWGFIHEMKLDEDLAGDAFVFLLDRPVQLKGLISTPIGIRKSILLKMMMRDAK